MFAQLGNHIFQGLKSPSAVSEGFAMKYGTIPLVNGKDTIQPTGEELNEISLTVRYAIDFCDPATEIDALKKSMWTAEVLPFIMGDGTIVGSFVITQVDKTTERTSPTGTLEAAIVNISLLEKACETVSSPQGQALESRAPAAETPAAPVASPSNEIANDISEAKTTIGHMKNIVSQVKKRTTSLKQGVRNVQKAAEKTQQLYTTAKTKYAATKKIIIRATQLPTSLDEALKYADNLAKLDNVTDVNVLEMNVGELSNSAEKVSMHAAPVVAFSATREGGK